MNTNTGKLLTFIDIFKTDFKKSNEENDKYISKIIIPKFQRDYAQGRMDEHAKKVRVRFLDAIEKAIANDETLTLDFIYGSLIEEHDGKGDWILTLLDGQQRITTLFLLHWYASWFSDNIDKSCLKQFLYETRPDSRRFCEFLTEKFTPNYNMKLVEEIRNNKEFSLSWENDPTIASMLVMIDLIEDKFSKWKNTLWTKLQKINFYFLPIKDFGLTDDLYIKMNTRGKPLTTFENWKAEFEKLLKENNVKNRKDLINYIDGKWTDIFWKNLDENNKNKINTVDEMFLKFYRYICDLICFKQDKNASELNYKLDEVDLLDLYFNYKSNITTNSLLEKPNDLFTNLEFLTKCFDCTEYLNDEFFNNLYYDEIYEAGKVKFYDIRGQEKNLLKKCLLSNSFRLADQIMLYAIIFYLINQNKFPANIDVTDTFKHRFRILRNLIINSENEITATSKGAAGNRIPLILKQVEQIIKGENPFDFEQGAGFNDAQVEEENMKYEWIKHNIEYKDKLFQLEDNDYLRGKIAIVGLDDVDNFTKFKKLFAGTEDVDGKNPKLDKINCALMIMSENCYWESDQPKVKDIEKVWRYQIGTKIRKIDGEDIWRDFLFSKIRINYPSKTRDAMIRLLNSNENLDEKYLDILIENYKSKCKHDNYYDFKYYYISYPSFRSDRYGKCSWQINNNRPYEYYISCTRTN